MKPWTSEWDQAVLRQRLVQRLLLRLGNPLRAPQRTAPDGVASISWLVLVAWLQLGRLVLPKRWSASNETWALDRLEALEWHRTLLQRRLGLWLLRWGLCLGIRACSLLYFRRSSRKSRSSMSRP